jgi:hypothetical protein
VVIGLKLRWRTQFWLEAISPRQRVKKCMGRQLRHTPAGKFKGGATLALAVEKLVIHGTPYIVRCSGVEQELKGKGKRMTGMVGGGAAGGALMGDDRQRSW